MNTSRRRKHPATPNGHDGILVVEDGSERVDERGVVVDLDPATRNLGTADLTELDVQDHPGAFRVQGNRPSGEDYSFVDEEEETTVVQEETAPQDRVAGNFNPEFIAVARLVEESEHERPQEIVAQAEPSPDGWSRKKIIVVSACASVLGVFIIAWGIVGLVLLLDGNGNTSNNSIEMGTSPVPSAADHSTPSPSTNAQDSSMPTSMPTSILTSTKPSIVLTSEPTPVISQSSSPTRGNDESFTTEPTRMALASEAPTESPSRSPTTSERLSFQPTRAPSTTQPTTSQPTRIQNVTPTTLFPTLDPTPAPTNSPTDKPTNEPSSPFYTTVGGMISEDSIWPLSGSPYRVTSTIQVAQGISLTILPGVQVVADASIHSENMFLVHGGTLTVHGTENQPIVFDGESSPETVTFFQADSSPEGSFVDLDYCIFQNGGRFWYVLESGSRRFGH